METTLRLGEEATVRRRFFGKTWSVVYAGMLHDDRYALVMTWCFGHMATSYNLFLPSGVREVPFKGGTLRVVDVSPEQIRFRCETS